MGWPAAEVDRAVGALVASAAGDASGAPYQFGGPNPAALCAMEGGGRSTGNPASGPTTRRLRSPCRPCSPTMPTTCAASAGDARLDRSRPRDVGNQTWAVLGDAARSATRLGRLPPVIRRPTPTAAGNGALMRTGPVALPLLNVPARWRPPRPSRSPARRTRTPTVSMPARCLVDGDRPEDHGRPTRPTLLLRRGAPRSVSIESRSACVPVAAADPEAAGRDPAEFHASIGSVVGALQAAVAAITMAERDHGDTVPLAPRHHPGARCSQWWRHRHRGGDRWVVAGRGRGASGAPIRWATATAWGPPVRRAAAPVRRPRTTRRLAANGGGPDSAGWPGHPRLSPGTPPNSGFHYSCARSTESSSGKPLGCTEPSTTARPSSCRGAGWAWATSPTVSSPHRAADRHRARRQPRTWRCDRRYRPTVASMADEGERVFVHCVVSENRTPTIAVAYLMARGESVRRPSAESRQSSAGGRASSSERPRRGRGDAVEHVLISAGPRHPPGEQPQADLLADSPPERPFWAGPRHRVPERGIIA